MVKIDSCTERELLEHYRPWLRAAAWSMTTPDRVDDLAQEGWIELWREIPRADGPAPADWWLKRAAIRRMQEVAFRRWRTPAATQDMPAGLGRQSPESGLHTYTEDLLYMFEQIMPGMWVDLPAVELSYHEGEILAALNRLTPREREYVYLRFWCGTGPSGPGYRNPLLSASFNRSNADKTWRSARTKLAEDLKHLAVAHG